MRLRRAGIVQLGNQTRVQVLADVADLLEQDVTVRELPRRADPCELVVIAARDDRLERQIGRRLEDDERRSGLRGPGIFVDVDDDVRGQVAGAKRAVVVDAVRAAVEVGDGVGSR